ncbi:MAG: hypothetical protein ACRCZ0_09980 [Cetobacterium sp.]
MNVNLIFFVFLFGLAFGVGSIVFMGVIYIILEVYIELRKQFRRVKNGN